MRRRTVTITGRPISDDVQLIFGFKGLTVTGLEVLPTGSINVAYACGQTLIYTPMIALIGDSYPTEIMEDVGFQVPDDEPKDAPRQWDSTPITLQPGSMVAGYIRTRDGQIIHGSDFGVVQEPIEVHLQVGAVVWPHFGQ